MFAKTEMEILVRRNCATKYLKQVKTNGYNIVHLGEEETSDTFKLRQIT